MVRVEQQPATAEAAAASPGPAAEGDALRELSMRDSRLQISVFCKDY